jgi:hypothetical protein
VKATATFCEKKRVLFETYQQATATYSDAVAKLQRMMGTMERPEYDALYQMTEALRLNATAAREALNDHVALHGC